MKEIIYHGSKDIIQKPEYGKGKRNNDYGKGFYCTREIEMAKEWACATGNDGYANQYEIDYNGLEILCLNSPDYTILNWLAILAKNRTYWQKGTISEQAKNYLQEHFLIDTSPYDVIVGYRADDSYFSFAQDFVAGTISLRKLSKAMYLGTLGEQIVLMSRKAFGNIRYLGSESVLAKDYYEKKIARDLEARRAYRATKSSEADIDDIYILDIMREEMKNNDPRLQ